MYGKVSFLLLLPVISLGVTLVLAMLAMGLLPEILQRNDSQADKLENFAVRMSLAGNKEKRYEQEKIM